MDVRFLDIHGMEIKAQGGGTAPRGSCPQQNTARGQMPTGI